MLPFLVVAAGIPIGGGEFSLTLPAHTCVLAPADQHVATDCANADFAVSILDVPQVNRHALSREAIESGMRGARYEIVRVGKLPAIRAFVSADKLLYQFQGRTALHGILFHGRSQAKTEEILRSVRVDAPDDIEDFGKPLPPEEGLTGKPREILIGLLAIGALIGFLFKMLRVGDAIKRRLP